MDNSRSALWDKGSEVQNRLRQPKFQNSKTIENLIANSTLKVDAPEFIPSNNRTANASHVTNSFPEALSNNLHNQVRNNQKPSVQNRLNRFKANQSSYDYSTSENPNLHQWQDYQNHAFQNNHVNEIDETPDMIRLKQIISSLINYPGQFDDLLMVFMESIFPYFSDIIALSEISQLLVSEAINCPNFRYNGARLCWYIEQDCPEFRAELHLRCKKELEQNPNRQNVVLFIAELYTQLPHSAIYGGLLIESLKQLLPSGGNDNVKCVCQALKLTGYSLDQNNRSALDDVFMKLNGLKNSVNGSALTLLNSVLNLRENNWGRSPTETPDNVSSENEIEFHAASDIIYQTDHELTREEHAFLVANLPNEDYLIDSDDPDDLCDPEPEMDEEIQAAFKEFVKLSKR